MIFENLGLRGAWLCTSNSLKDKRGTFREWFKASEIFENTGIEFEVKQANVSMSNRGVIRGIHYTLSPSGQLKWVTCVNGRIIDVIVDVVPNSPTFGEYVAVELKGDQGRSILIGSGMGHAFISLQDGSTVSYLLSSTYSPGDEYEINPMDTEIGIDWNMDHITNFVLSDKDSSAPTLAECASEGKLPPLNQ